MACRTCPRWPAWVGRADRVRLHRMVRKARIYSPDGMPPVRMLLVLLANLKKGKVIRSIRDPFYYWSTALGLNILDFIGGDWVTDSPLHPVAQVAWDELSERVACWRAGKNLAEYPRQVGRPPEPEFKDQGLLWSYTESWPRKEAVGLDETIEAYRQAAYFYSGLLDMVDKVHVMCNSTQTMNTSATYSYPATRRGPKAEDCRGHVAPDFFKSEV